MTTAYRAEVSRILGDQATVEIYRVVEDADIPGTIADQYIGDITVMVDASAEDLAAAVKRVTDADQRLTAQLNRITNIEEITE